MVEDNFAVGCTNNCSISHKIPYLPICVSYLYTITCYEATSLQNDSLCKNVIYAF